jgi:hypothetical protein
MRSSAGGRGDFRELGKRKIRLIFLGFLLMSDANHAAGLRKGRARVPAAERGGSAPFRYVDATNYQAAGEPASLHRIAPRKPKARAGTLQASPDRASGLLFYYPRYLAAPADPYSLTRAVCFSLSSEVGRVPVTYAFALSNRYFKPSTPDASQ